MSVTPGRSTIRRSSVEPELETIRARRIGLRRPDEIGKKKAREESHEREKPIPDHGGSIAKPNKNGRRALRRARPDFDAQARGHSRRALRRGPCRNQVIFPLSRSA